MNMISTSAFQNEMDTSDEQKGLVSKLVTAWEKKNAKVRFGVSRKYPI